MIKFLKKSKKILSILIASALSLNTFAVSIVTAEESNNSTATDDFGGTNWQDVSNGIMSVIGKGIPVSGSSHTATYTYGTVGPLGGYAVCTMSGAAEVDKTYSINCGMYAVGATVTPPVYHWSGKESDGGLYSKTGRSAVIKCRPHHGCIVGALEVTVDFDVYEGNSGFGTSGVFEGGDLVDSEEKNTFDFDSDMNAFDFDSSVNNQNYSDCIGNFCTNYSSDNNYNYAPNDYDYSPSDYNYSVNQYDYSPSNDSSSYENNSSYNGNYSNSSFNNSMNDLYGDNNNSYNGNPADWSSTEYDSNSSSTLDTYFSNKDNTNGSVTYNENYNGISNNELSSYDTSDTTPSTMTDSFNSNYNSFNEDGSSISNDGSYDTDSNGIADSWDTNGDGNMDAWDTNGNGIADAWDTNGDGELDSWDTTGDGVADTWDTNGDGVPDAWDTTGDGVPDAWDTDGDGIADTFASDSDYYSIEDYDDIFGAIDGLSKDFLLELFREQDNMFGFGNNNNSLLGNFATYLGTAADSLIGQSKTASDAEMYNFAKNILTGLGYNIDDIINGATYDDGSAYTDPDSAWNMNRLTTLLSRHRLKVDNDGNISKSIKEDMQQSVIPNNKKATSSTYGHGALLSAFK